MHQNRNCMQRIIHGCAAECTYFIVAALHHPCGISNFSMWALWQQPHPQGYFIFKSPTQQVYHAPSQQLACQLADTM